MTGFAALQYFVETSFHQDWDFDGPTDVDVVRAFISRDRAKVPQVADDIDRYIASGPSPDKTAGWLYSLGCAYDPSSDDLDANEWLTRLAGLLRGS